MPYGVVAPEFYNKLVAMHGTIMVFFVTMPLLLGAFGNFLLPLMIGARDMAFPRLNMLSVWTLARASVVLLSSFFVPAGAAGLRLDLLSAAVGQRGKLGTKFMAPGGLPTGGARMTGSEGIHHHPNYLGMSTA